MTSEMFDQSPYRCRLEWGRRGAREAAARGDAVVIVDVLRFSTTVATAIHRGAIIYPCADDAAGEELARRVGAELAVSSRGAQTAGAFSLSPRSFDRVGAGTKVVLPSANGSLCASVAPGSARLFAGALVNATAVAEAAGRLVDETDLCVTVVPCGERWAAPWDGEGLRFAVEDYLGAGAIIAGISCEKSPEARACEAAFAGLRSSLCEVLLECASGRELRLWGLEADVLDAARLDVFAAVPVMLGECFVRG
ncbi:MAG: 2-phosphosulfolactate phosphatase [Dehalococcoidia bacterium]